MKINLRAMMLASGLMISMIPFMPGEASAEKVSVPDSRTLSDITYMQDMSGQICENTSENATKQLIDTRDGKSYWVTKLKDGNCWMTQNLDLDLSIYNTLTPENTDLLSNWTPLANTQTTASPNFTTVTNDVQSWDPARGGADKYCNTSGCNLTASANDGHDAQGNYYSWGAATAGQAATLTSNASGEQSTQSICPKGWTLPTGGADGRQYNTLVKDLTVIQLTTTPYYFVYSGDVSYKSLDHAGSQGHYWSSTATSISNAYPLIFSTSVAPSNSSNRKNGLSVRCVARPKESKKTLSDLTYMQEMTTGVCEKSAKNESKQLIDQRDGKTYWVTKLKDGNCWMTQNLALDLDTTKPLTNTDSDISSSYTPTANTQQGTITKFPSSSDRTLSYNPGEYVYTTPTEQNSCGSSGIAKLEGCPNWTLVTGLSKDTSGNTQAHYLAGNYYSYEVATAGYTDSSNSAPNSICPKGWQLPENQASTAGTTVAKSYRNLLDSYGWNWNQGSDPSKYSNSLTGTKDGITYDIRSNPLYFVYGGIVASSSLYYAGRYGYYWSSTAYDSSGVYSLNFDTNVNPSNSTNRYLGRSVRCVARADVPDNNDNVTITITPTLSLDVAATTEIPYTAGGISTGTLSATVKSNQQHALQLSATQPNLVNEADNSKIIPADAGVSAGTSAWGIKKKESAAGTSLGSTTDVSAYTALTSTPDIFYRSAAGIEGTAPINFTVGISTDSSVASGTYSTNVTVTATTI